MKNVIIAILALIPLSALTGFRSISQFEPVAVVELFTSQGCSSCPAADRLLSETIADSKKKGKKLFALSFHVDYWNRLGWADPFSDKKYTQRQDEYRIAMNTDAYTPQMVVNGTTEFVGSNESKLSSALQEAWNNKPVTGFETLTASFQSGKLHVIYKLNGDVSGNELHFALVSLVETTSVKRGENEGRVLKNENVVRQFISIPAAASGEIAFESSPVPANDNMAVIGYIQRNANLEIIGASTAEIHHN